MALMPFELLPPPIKTDRDRANSPPVFSPIDWAWRSISAMTLVNSVLSTARLPVKVPDADCVARVRARSRSLLMLLMPPSMVWRVLSPSLALRIPCCRTAWSLRKLLAIDSPAASSPLDKIRRPDVTRPMALA